MLVGLIGAGIQGSRTPVMHEREAQALGIPYVYRLLDLDRMGLTVEALPRLVDDAERMGFDGLNITHPCKERVLSVLDELSPEARSIGAVNTVLFRDGRRRGHNTDIVGFRATVRLELQGRRLGRVVLLGAGGAGAAAAHALVDAGVEHLTIVDVDRARAATLAGRVGAVAGSVVVVAGADPRVATRGADGVVNATPVGMAKSPGMPLSASLLRPDLWVVDVVYLPLETELLRQARLTGCHAVGGVTMAVFQAAAAFELFTGIAADPGRMRATFAALG